MNRTPQRYPHFLRGPLQPRYATCGCALIVAALLATVTPARAAADTNQDAIVRATLQTRQDVLQAAAALNTLRDTIAAQRAPLAREHEALQAEVQQARAEANRRRAAERRGEQERDALAATVHGLEAEVNFAFTALQEYRRALATRTGPAVNNALAEALATADAALADNRDGRALAPAANALLSLAADWNRARLGGEAFDGACLDGTGREHAGRFVVAGPMTWFAGGDVAGIVGRRLGSGSPSLLLPLDVAGAAAIAAVTTGKEAVLPVDSSGGDAVRVAGVREPLWVHLMAGGNVMIPLGIVGALAALLATWKFFTLRRIRPPVPADLECVLQPLARGDVAGATSAAAAMAGPLGEVLREGIVHRTAPPENLEELLHERILGMVPTLDRHLGTLAVLGGVAPLLGLLGTVTGMIHTFQLITVFGSGDARLLSSGIAEALVTTEVGLVIAIPVVLVHAHLTRRLSMILTGLEQAMVAFVNRLKNPLAPPPPA